MNKKSKRNLIIPLIIILMCLISLTYSSLFTIKWKNDSNKTKENLEKIQNTVIVEEIENEEKVEIIEQPEEIPKFNPYWDYIKMNLISVNFD